MTLLVEIERAFNQAVKDLADIEPEVAWEGRSYAPAGGKPWLQVSTPARNRQPTSIGTDGAHSWNGTFQLVVKSPSTLGNIAALKRAEAIAKRLPRGRTLVSGAARVVFQAVTIPASYDSADFISVPVVIQWFAQEAPTPP